MSIETAPACYLAKLFKTKVSGETGRYVTSNVNLCMFANHVQRFKHGPRDKIILPAFVHHEMWLIPVDGTLAKATMFDLSKNEPSRPAVPTRPVLQALAQVAEEPSHA